MLKYPMNVFVAHVEEAAFIIQGKKQQLLYSLTIDNTERNNDRFVTVICLHSNGANRQKSDIVTNQMIRYLSKQGFQEITFVYLFPYVTFSTDQLNDLVSNESLDRIVEENLDVIMEYIQHASTVILAWGKRPSYIPFQPFKHVVESLKKLIIEENCIAKTHIFEYGRMPELSNDGQPHNPYRLSIDRIKSFNIQRLIVKEQT